jgi:F420-dependent oxidoreductase-like protein
MEVCLMIEGQEGVSWPQWVALAGACEENGFAGLFRSDHYVSFGHPAEWGALDAWATLAALGPLTSKIRLGTLVSPVTFRPPSILAKSVLTADFASGGRVELGMGAGWFEGEHSAYGFPFPTASVRYEMLEEQAEIVHRLLDHKEDEVTFKGRHYQLDGCHPLPKPLQDPHPPLILGGGAGPKASALAARWADEYNTFSADPAECGRRRKRLLAACEAINRDPGSLRFSIMTGTLIGASETELRARASRLMAQRGDGGDPAAFLDDWRLKRTGGTPDEVLERLATFAAVGVQRVMLQHLLHDDLDALELIGQEIIPEAAKL